MPDRPPPIRYLSAVDVESAMPPVAERLRLAERTLVALADGTGELPPKIGVHPRAAASFGHAMPARLAGDRDDGRDDLLGAKWVVGFPTNGPAGLRTIHATVVLNDPRYGWPVAILDGAPVTAQRTAAVSGVATARWAPQRDRPLRVAIIGAGVQGRAHHAVLGHVLPDCRLRIFDRHRERAAALAELASATTGIAAAETADDARTAIADADVVVTCASFAPADQRQVMPGSWLAADALVVPVDYATYCSAEVARSAAAFLVDERAQFLANRDAAAFDDYPDPAATFGEAILTGLPRPDGVVVAMHLGVGLADVVFGAAILATARERGIGLDLEQ
ncbi:MAG: hypothetical protein ACJ77N_06175 [Chloroflexota bacterium]